MSPRKNTVRALLVAMEESGSPGMPVVKPCLFRCYLLSNAGASRESLTQSLGRNASGRRRIKLLLVIGTLDVGGTESQLVQLALGLHKDRFAVSVCCLSKLGPLAERLSVAGIRVTSFGAGVPGWLSPPALRRPVSAMRGLINLARLMRTESPVITHGFLFEAYVLTAFAGRLAGVPVILASRRSLGNFKDGRPHYALLERLANRMTDLVVANSEAVRNDVLEREQLHPSKVLVIHNGVDLERYDPVSTTGLRIPLGISADAPVVACVANFIHYKGHGVLLEALSSVAHDMPQVRALLIGDGPLRDTWIAQAASLGLSENVMFLGIRKDVPDLLRTSDMVVHPSFQEGFSNAIIEAMAAGKPVVATRVGGNSEAVVDGETGVLVPPRDPEALAQAIRGLLVNRERARRMGEAGRRRAEQFDLREMIRHYENLYERVASRYQEDQRCAG